MKKILIASLIFGLGTSFFSGNAVAALSWWLQPTICKPNMTNCYSSMSAGYDTEMWDATGNCRGMKYICPEVTTATNDSVPVLMGKLEIAAKNGIGSDFDTDVLNGDCFGSRKTTANGTKAMVGGSYVNVYCPGMLYNADETLPNGEITLGAQPICKDLAPDGWVAALNQKCYGKYFDAGSYYIECAGNDLLPSRIVQLNGADAIIGAGAGNYDYPTDTASARNLMDTMQATSAAQRKKYY